MSASSKKQTIPKPLRSEVWRKDNKTLDAECPICKRNIISADNFECGHIISEHDGGKTELPNLKAICGSCNKSMGTKNMNDFKQVVWSGRKNIQENTVVYQSDTPTIVSIAVPSIIQNNTQTITDMYLSFSTYIKPRAHMSDVSMWYDNYMHICDAIIKDTSIVKNKSMNIMQCIDRFSQCNTWYNTASSYERGKLQELIMMLNREMSKIN